MINVRLVQENPISARIKPEHGIKVLDHTVYLYDPSVIDDQVNLAKDWAIKMDGKVVEDGEEVDYSSKYYASEAKTSEINAATSASSASTSANLASGYANSASADAGTATTKASEAAASASSAATSASNASTSATNASNSASIAVAAATDPNVVAVGTNIQNINKVADNETNINTVVGMNEDILTVANISNYVADVGAISADVSTVAGIASDISTVSSHAADVVNVSDNMSSVVSAVDYAAEAKVWAEGTDSEVEDYGGEKSSKGWAARAKELVDSIGSVLHYKGSVATRDDLPALGQVLGDMYNILSDGSNVVWTGTGWDEISGVVDLSEYRKAADQDTIDAGKVPTSRTINNKVLTEDITLTPADVGAQPAGNYVTTDTAQTISEAKTFTKAVHFTGTGDTNAVFLTENTRIDVEGTTKTILGMANGQFYINHNTYDLVLRGRQTRPKYNGSDLALTSDIPTTYVHEQGTASATWTINHNLHKFPSVSIVDSSGNEIVAEVSYIDQDTCVVTMKGASKGKAYLN